MIIIFLLAVLVCPVSNAGDSVGVASAVVIRSQLRSIAGEVISRAKLDTKNEVVLWIEGEGQISLAVNAFVEELQKLEYVTILGTGGTTKQTLHIILYGSDVRIRPVEDKFTERSIATSLEAGVITGEDRKAVLLGTFRRETIDKALVFPVSQMFLPQPDEGDGLFQQLLPPLIILSGAVLIIFLLFTVRS